MQVGKEEYSRMIDCSKCIHYPVCDHSRDYFKHDECSYYSEESRQHGEWIKSLLQTLVDNGCITAIQANRILKESETNEQTTDSGI